VLLLSHHPDFFFEAAAADIELTLSGHTHGGQITFFGKTPLRHSAFGYWRGLFEEQGAHLYVSRGVGVTFLPLRIGASPEIPILRLKTPARSVSQSETAAHAGHQAVPK
jgi:predicted MPP superfamily phosphohydrolase